MSGDVFIAGGKHSFAKKQFLIFAVIMIACVTLLRVPFFSDFMFFNSDEALFANGAHALIDGDSLYHDYQVPTSPAIFFLYATVFRLFGRYNMLALHAALLVTVLLISGLLYLIARESGHARCAGWVAFFFGLFSHTCLGMAAFSFQAEWLVCLFCAAGVYLFIRYIQSHARMNLLVSGALFAAAAFSKQPAILYGLVTFLFLCWRALYTKISLRRFAAEAFFFLFGFALILAAAVGYFLFHNVLPEAWFWLWVYPRVYYVSALSFSERLSVFFLYFAKSLISRNSLLYVFFVAGVVLQARRLSFLRKQRLGSQDMCMIYFLLWGMVSYADASLSGRHLDYYYIVMIPSFSLVAAFAVNDLFFLARKSKRKRTPATRVTLLAIFIIFGAAFSLWRNASALRFKSTLMRDDERSMAKMVAYLQDNTAPSDRILMLYPAFEEVYFRARRKSAVRSYFPGIMVTCGRKRQLTEEFFRDLSMHPPRLVVEPVGKGLNFGWCECPTVLERIRGFLARNHYVVKDTLRIGHRFIPAARIYERQDG